MAAKQTKSAASASSGIDLANIFETVKSVTLTPAQSLPKLLGGKKTLNELFILTGVVGLATLIGALGAAFLLYGMFGFGFAIQYALVAYIGAVITPIIGLFVLKAIDPSLSKLGYATEEWGKIIVYTSLPFLAAGILQIIPIVGMYWVQSLAGLYSLYLLYFTLTSVKKVSQDKVLPLIVVYIIVLGLIQWVVYVQILSQLVWNSVWGGLWRV